MKLIVEDIVPRQLERRDLEALYQFKNDVEVASLRDALKRHLIRERIYPAILWPIEAAPTLVDEQLVSQRMLFIHIDGRYTASDIERIAEAVRRFSD